MSGEASIWTAAEAEAATGGRSSRDWRASGVSIDTRTLKPGDLFVALKATRDGHEFVVDALARGAVAALVSRKPDGVPADAALLVADDVDRALAALAAAARARIMGRVVAVTGSVGKTTTKEMLRAALFGQGATHAAEGSLNNQWGVPLSLARMPRTTQFAVFEIGMNHAGEIEPLTRLVRPDVAIVTAVEPVHMEFFASLEAVAEAKAEIFAGLTAGNGTAVVNGDSPFYPLLAKRAHERRAKRVLAFGTGTDAWARLLTATPDAGGEGLSVETTIGDKAVAFRLPVPARHWAMNALAALTAVSAIGADVPRAAQALGDMAPPEGRGRRHDVATVDGYFTLLDESYNASPAAMRAAFATAGAVPTGPGGRRIAVLGDMLELGQGAERFHAELAPALAASGFDLVLTAGPLMDALHRALPTALRNTHAARADDLVPVLRGLVRSGDVVVIKGSHGMGMHRIVAALVADAAKTQSAVNGN
ncbi:MAG TPA: UDP-N-acetylmuramoyl-tripeptide--D-alanyl-D-alanine ligase [Alphaproteobacteria bacterium]|nr:UDP-N-acetylmuramoyl-tripeptide--D-alanyl-D-alanine ligase [Alphaproteobacteria bacterium]